MREGRKPAQCVNTLEGVSTKSSYINEDRETIHQTDVENQLFVRNFCNHEPLAPKLFVIPANQKPRAKIVQETHAKLQSAYHKPKSSLKTLQFHDLTGYRVKSQRREAAMALLQVMNHYQDDSSGQIGRLQASGTFHSLSLSKLAYHAGIQYKRAKRAMSDIIRAGYMKVIKQFVRCKDTGVVKGLPSLRSFLPKFYIDLDVDGAIWTKWYSQRSWAKERNQKKMTKSDRKKSQAMIGFIKDSLTGMGAAVKKGAGKMLGKILTVPSVKNAESLVAYRREMTKKAIDMYRKEPSRSISDYYKALIEAYPFK